MSRGTRADGLAVPASVGRASASHRTSKAEAQREEARHQGQRRGTARDRTYRINPSEAKTLATVGAFRIVPVNEIGHERTESRSSDNVRRLVQAGLLERQTVVIGGRSTPVVALTREGKAALDRTQESSGESKQQYHVGFVKPRETAHDAQMHALYRTEVARLEQAGERATRVILDYELKRDYQSYLNRRDRPADETVDDARLAFAAEHGLPIVNGHLELPDLRIEVETEDGRTEYRDLELVTEHYSRAQLAGKARAGFTAYRAGTRAASGGSAKTGGTPFDPHHLEWLT